MKVVDLSSKYMKDYLCCLEPWSDEMKDSGNKKKKWYAKANKNGLRVKLALDEDGTPAGMIQYIPVEKSFVHGEGLYFVKCVWVHGHKEGMGNRQGGGMGIFGDLLFSDATRYGNSPIPTMLGPTSSVVEDAYKLTVGNVQEALNPDVENTHFGSEAVDFVNRHANPTNTFYTKAIVEQYVARNLKIFLDEDYERNEARKLRKREREYGQTKFEFLQN